jgi:DNA topoisomerase III
VKTLIVAEKPSVGRDIASALPGSFAKHDNYLESNEWIVTWAVGHLVELAAPEQYDDRFKKWRMADLPIVPEQFQLQPIDGKAAKQLKLIHKLMARDDVEAVVNACDAGREGELIFAYVYETAKEKKPVRRLWLNSMTAKAIGEAFAQLRPGEEMASLEAAARSRSEADWLVGMNATRAASIRLRAAFDGAVSLGRVQTPTLALVARREEQIRAFRPEPYWLVEALFGAANGDYSSRYLGGKRLPEEEAAAVVAATRDRPGTITKLEKKEERERPDLLYDLTSLQRHANTLFGFSARRTLQAAQRLYEEHKAITYPRTSSRFLSGDLVEEIRPTAALVGKNPEYAKAAAFVTGLEQLPLGRVVNDKKVTDHHAIIPTRSQHDLGRMGEDERRIYDLVAKRFLAVFHPEAVWERTRVETTVEEHVFRTSGRVLVTAGWREVYGEEARPRTADSEDDSGGDQQLPRLEQGEGVETKSVESLRKETQPPRRFTEASLLAAMETAGKDIQDAELREAMKDAGIGTPATRAAIIERLIQVGYIEREGRALHATEKGIQVIRLLGEHPLTSAELTGDWEHRLGLIEQGTDSRPAFIDDIVKFTAETVGELDKLKDVKIERANLGPCPICGRDVIENRKGYSCWTKDDPGCGFVIWKQKAGKTLTPAIVKELMANRRTAKPVPGFKGRSGRTFSAKLKLVQTDEGKWRVEFDEEWAQQPRPADGDEAAAKDDSAAPTQAEDGAKAAAEDGAKAARRRRKAVPAE